MRWLAGLAAGLILGIVGLAHALTPSERVIVDYDQPIPLFDWDFRRPTLPAELTFSRAASENEFTYGASGCILTSFGSGAPAMPACDPATGTVLGLAIWPSITNSALRSRDFTNATWVKSNMSTALNQTGVDNGANSASLLTATAGNATVKQSITSGSNNRCFSVYLKRSSGTGEIDITFDNGSTWTDVSTIVGALSSTTWKRPYVCQAATTNPTIGLRIVTNGDAIIADIAQQETTGLVPSAPIITTTANVSRGARDLLKFNSLTLPQAWTAVMSFYMPVASVLPASQFPNILNYSDGTTSNTVQTTMSSSSSPVITGTKVTKSGSSIGTTGTNGYGVVNGANTIGISVDASGSAATSIDYSPTGSVATSSAFPGGLNTLVFGSDGSGAGTILGGYLTRVRIFAGFLPNWRLQDIQHQVP